MLRRRSDFEFADLYTGFITYKMHTHTGVILVICVFFMIYTQVYFLKGAYTRRYALRKVPTKSRGFDERVYDQLYQFFDVFLLFFNEFFIMIYA